MEKETAVHIKDKIQSALENIERLKNDSINFADTKDKLITTSSKFNDFLDQLEEALKQFQIITQEISSSLIDESLEKMEGLIKDSRNIVDNLRNHIISDNEAFHSEIRLSVQTDTKIIRNYFLGFGFLTIILFAINILITVLGN